MNMKAELLQIEKWHVWRNSEGQRYAWQPLFEGLELKQTLPLVWVYIEYLLLLHYCKWKICRWECGMVDEVSGSNGSYISLFYMAGNETLHATDANKDLIFVAAKYFFSMKRKSCQYYKLMLLMWM